MKQEKTNTQNDKNEVFLDNSNAEMSNNLDVIKNPPADVMRKTFFNHAGVILGNIGLFACVIGVMLFFSFMIPVLYLCLLLILTLGTAGVIFLIIPNFADWWNLFPKLSESVGSTIPASLYVLSMAIIFTALALTFTLLSKEYKRYGRVLQLIITLVISIIAFIIFYLNLAGV